MPAATKDAVLGSAVDLAREVAVGLAEDPSDVGEYLGLVVEGERLVSHRFASAARGYRGWEWTVTVARVPRGRTATVCEAELLPGPDAVLGQAWLPWSERIRPGDIGPGDVLPFKADDPRLEPGWTPTGDPELDDVAIDELALARVRVLSPEGRDEAAERWYRGPHGPTSAGVARVGRRVRQLRVPGAAAGVARHGLRRLRQPVVARRRRSSSASTTAAAPTPRPTRRPRRPTGRPRTRSSTSSASRRSS